MVKFKEYQMSIFPQSSQTDTHNRGLFLIFIILLAIFSGISIFTRAHVVDGDAINYTDAQMLNR